MRFFTVLILLVSMSATAAQRGISVTLRQSESVNAPVLEERELYQESYALVIGVDDYNNGWPRLSNAVRDAEKIAEALEQKGFEVELHRNLDSNELPQVFKRFFILKGENPEARLFVWFAGHGATVDGEGYLIPADAPVITQSTEFKFSSVALRDFGTFMRQSASKHVYAVFDACFAGTVFTAQRAMPPAAITRATTLPVRQFLTSGDADQTVSDDGQFRELFVRAILGEEPADANGDGYLTASEIGMYLGDRVTNLTESAQTPRYGKLRDKDFDRGDFVFVIDPDLKPVGSVNPEAELVFWDSVKDTDDSDMLLAYLSEYPSGRFTNLARIKLKRFGERLQSGLVKLSMNAIQKRFLTTKASAIREFPSEEANILRALPSDQELMGVGRTSDASPWILIAIEGVPFGYVSSSDLRELSAALKVDGVGSSQDLLVSGRLEERRELRKSDNLDLRLSTALDDVIASESARPFAEPASEGQATKEVPVSGGSQSAATSITNPVLQDAAGAVDESEEPVRVSTSEGSGGLIETSTAQSRALSVESSSRAEVEAGGEKTKPIKGPVGDIRPVGSTQVGSWVEDGEPEGKGALPSVATVLTGPTEATPVLQHSSEIASKSLEEKEHSTTNIDGESRANPSGEPASNRELVQGALEQNAMVAEPNETTRQTLDESSHQTSLKASDKSEDEEGEVAVGVETTGVNLESRGAAVAYSEFVRRYINAAINGNVGAQATLGYFYEVGENVEADQREAIRWYEKAASNDHLEATLRLAELEIASGQGQKGVYWYKKAALLGDIDAQAMLGYFYQTGEHVAVDLAEAIKWYLAAADQDHVAAQNNLGRLYQIGEGVSKDLDQAIYWYERAAKNGSQAAARNLQKLLP